MKFRHLLQTTAVRLALRYVALYALVLGLGLGALMLTSIWLTDEQRGKHLQQDYAALLREIENGNAAAAVTQRLEGALAAGRFYLLVALNGEKLAGNLLR